MDEQHLDSEVSPDVLISLSLRLSRVTLENNTIFFLVSIRPLMTDKSRTLSLSLAPFLVCMSLYPNPDGELHCFAAEKNIGMLLQVRTTKLML